MEVNKKNGNKSNRYLVADRVPLLERGKSCDESVYDKSNRSRGCCKKYAIVWIILAIALVGLTLGLVYGLKNKERHAHNRRIGAVVSNGDGCANIGGKILNDGGSAADAMIATLLCEGVILPHSMGAGGGFIATIYTKATGNVETLMARETAPAAAHQDMFIKRPITGALAAAVPSELYGYWCLHAKYGKLPWKDLFQPTIELCENGLRVSKHLGNILILYAERILSEPSMAEIFLNPHTNKLYTEGEIMYRPQLAETLRVVAEEGPQAIYRGGQIGRMLAEDIQEMGGIITTHDLESYEVRWEEPILARFTDNYSLYTTPLPSSGAVLAFILNVMAPMYTDRHDIYWHRAIETFKHAYGHRTNLGDQHFEPEVAEVYHALIDPQFAAQIRKLIKDDRTYTDMAYYGANFTNEEDHGTANVAVLAPNGDAIIVTSTVNSHFGAKVRSRRTGIILNDQMDDFSTPGVVNAYGIPASPTNYIKPGKRPMSSMCPSIILDKYGEVKLMVGAAGGSRITTTVAQTILRYFVLNDSIYDSVNLGRFHHQLAPMHVDVEPEVPKHTNDYLLNVGHELNFLPEDKAYSALTAIGYKTNEPQPVCDRRRTGSSVVVHLRD